jgi:hypothetical protein
MTVKVCHWPNMNGSARLVDTINALNLTKAEFRTARNLTLQKRIDSACEHDVPRTKTKEFELLDFSPQGNYTDGPTVVCRRI